MIKVMVNSCGDTSLFVIQILSNMHVILLLFLNLVKPTKNLKITNLCLFFPSLSGS